MPRQVKSVLRFITIYLTLLAQGVTQTNQGSKPIQVNSDSNEDAKAAFSLLGQRIGADEIVILIARKGTGERSKLNRKRLDILRFYIDVSRGTSMPQQNIVTAEGEPLRGRGRIEVYLRGRLFMVFIFSRNKNFAPET